MRIAFASASHRFVEPSMSVNRNVTVPDGRPPPETMSEYPTGPERSMTYGARDECEPSHTATQTRVLPNGQTPVRFRYLYESDGGEMYSYVMDVAITELRAHLGKWIDAARDGNDIIITDRGTPVARIVALDSSPVIDRLIAEGVISRPTTSTRPVAGARPRPAPKRPVADLVSEHRR
jgi:prevent-host-death family protein